MIVPSLSLLLTLAASAIASRPSPPPASPPKPDLTYLFTVNITTTPSLPIGTTPMGNRQFEPITGGSFSGPRLKGSVAPGGADWGVVGGNGVFSPDVVYVMQTEDGGGGGGGDILVRQRGRAPNVFSLFETGSDEYSWLNLVVAYGEATSSSDRWVVLEFWQVGLDTGLIPSS